MIPRTLSDTSQGGDSDPLDVLVLAPPLTQASVVKVHMIEDLRLVDQGEIDDKIIIIPSESPFSHIQSIGKLNSQFPGITQILKIWFSNYCRSDKTRFLDSQNKTQAWKIVEEAMLTFIKNIELQRN
jgi:inorganic pyrophosphatase